MFGFIPFGFNNGNLANMALMNIFQTFLNSNVLGTLASNNMFNAVMKETEDEYYIGANLSGVNQNDININQNNNYVTISVVTRTVSQQNIGNFIGQQNVCGQTSRCFYIENGNMDLLKVAYENGLLLIRIPKMNNMIEYNDYNVIDVTDCKLIE